MTVSMTHVIAATCEHYSLSVDDLQGASSRRRIARPRQIAFRVCSSLLGLSLTDIGRRFGDKDHTTVLYGINAVAERDDADEQTAERWVAARACQLANGKPRHKVATFFPMGRHTFKLETVFYGATA